MFCYTRFFSRVAQNAVNFALVLLIVDPTGLAFLSSLIVLALVVPSTVAGIVAGAAADVFPKPLLVFLANLARAAVTPVMAIVALLIGAAAVVNLRARDLRPGAG